MPIAATVEACLERHRLPYAVMNHPPELSGRDAAAAVGLAPAGIARPVVLRDERGYLMVVVPGDRQVLLHRLGQQLGRRLRPATDAELARLFVDCAAGAIPPLGPAYGLETVVDGDLLEERRICFVPGCREALLCVSRDAFSVMMREARRAHIAAARPVPAWSAEYA